MLSLFRSVLACFVLACGMGCVAHAQNDFRDLEIKVNGIPGASYYLVAPNARDSIGFVDMSGRAVFRRGVGLHTNLAAYGTKKLSVFTGNFGYFAYVIFDSTLTPIDTMTVTQQYVTDSHEGMFWTDSTFMMLGLEFRPFDMSGVVPGGQPNASLMVTVIQERHLVTDSVLFEWNAFGRIPVTDATSNIELRQRTIDYIHANSIVRDRDSNLIVSCRHLDEIIKIRRTDGSIMWRMGGVGSKNREFTFVNDEHDGVTGFSHQHSAVVTKTGTIMLFDNGNLKPNQRSRVVEYALDTVAMTATRVWSYTPEPPLYSPSQGSVEVLPNGNILIGYSATNDQRIAEEVDRNGSIVVQLRRTSDIPLQSYRVRGTSLGCTAIERTISKPGREEFADADSSTWVRLDVSKVVDSHRTRIERHHYRPHAWQVDDSQVCGPLSLRWTIRVLPTIGIDGSVRFDVGEIASPEKAILYHRSNEGSGPFKRCVTRYDADEREIILDTIIDGEYAIAYQGCVDPSPVFPIRGATSVPSTTSIRWSESPDATSYDVEVSFQEDVSMPYASFTTQRRDTVLRGLPPSTTAYWRVRKRVDNEQGVWSATSSFTTAGTVHVSEGDLESDQCVVWQHGDRLNIAYPGVPVKDVLVYDLMGTLVAWKTFGTESPMYEIAYDQLPRVGVVIVRGVDGSIQRRTVVRD